MFQCYKNCMRLWEKYFFIKILAAIYYENCNAARTKSERKIEISIP